MLASLWHDSSTYKHTVSLGCVLFECLTGQPAFTGEHLMAVLAKILLEDAPRVAEIRDDVPAALDDLVARMLCKDPGGRPADGRAVLPFGARLECLAAGSAVATLAGRGSATDQAAQAARCALAMRRILPDTAMVLATGRGVLEGRLPVGDVIDRAISLWRAQVPARGGPAGNTPPRGRPRVVAGAYGPIHLDEVTRGLLDARFEVLGLELHGERAAAEAETRRLLGKVTPCVGR
jgi:hypothetical protein